jgi:hypothetical protein
MAVCDFCSATYFMTEWTPSKKPRCQDRDLQGWMLSLRAACTICTLLFEQYKSAVQQAQRQKIANPTVKHPASVDEDPKKTRAVLWKIDEHIRSTSFEDLLLEWARKEANEIESTFQLPVYDVILQEAGDEAVWQLDFRPVVPSTGATTLVLPKQRFVVYDVRCRCRIPACTFLTRHGLNILVQSMARFSRERTNPKRPTTTLKSRSGCRTAGQTDIRCVRSCGNREKSTTGCPRA